MIVYTEWPGLIAAIKKAGHTPVLLPAKPKERPGMRYVCALDPDHDALAELKERNGR